jgi:hypothetical protein
MIASLFYESFSTTKKTVRKRPLLSKESEDEFEKRSYRGKSYA